MFIIVPYNHRVRGQAWPHATAGHHSVCQLTHSRARRADEAPPAE